MIRCRIGHIFFLGLDTENIEFLKEGKPLHFDGTQFGFEGIQFVVIYGDTNEDLKEDLYSIGILEKPKEKDATAGS